MALNYGIYGSRHRNQGGSTVRNDWLRHYGIFNRDIKTIGKHINNALKEELSNEVAVAKFATTSQHGAIEFDLLFRRNA